MSLISCEWEINASPQYLSEMWQQLWYASHPAFPKHLRLNARVMKRLLEKWQQKKKTDRLHFHLTLSWSFILKEFRATQWRCLQNESKLQDKIWILFKKKKITAFIKGYFCAWLQCYHIKEKFLILVTKRCPSALIEKS